ncbi:MAG TPA: HAMP domain-containing protein [Actinomycetota bacterium]|nr:HAMP domain-containing protein [Actinomycetota bacterium]
MRRRPGLASRLLAAQLLVIAVGALTLGAVDALVGPPLFRAHVRMALGDLPAGVGRHLQEALLTAGGIAIGVGVAASLLAAGAVSLLVTRRLSRPISALGSAAARLAAGDYSVRVPATGLGPELDTLTVGFNSMADALEGTEATRRRLLADVAHELRTPLATIDAYLEGLADGVREPVQETWDVLAGQSAWLRRLADDLSLVSRTEEGLLELHRLPMAPARLVAASIDAAAPGYTAKGVQLGSDVAGGLPNVDVDPDGPHAQVLGNLLSNALRHTPAGGKVVVSAARGPAPLPRRIRATSVARVCHTTGSLTEPSSTRRTGPSPREPTATRSKSPPVASSGIRWAAGPLAIIRAGDGTGLAQAPGGVLRGSSGRPAVACTNSLYARTEAGGMYGMGASATDSTFTSHRSGSAKSPRSAAARSDSLDSSLATSSRWRSRGGGGSCTTSTDVGEECST